MKASITKKFPKTVNKLHTPAARLMAIIPASVDAIPALVGVATVLNTSDVLFMAWISSSVTFVYSRLNDPSNHLPILRNCIAIYISVIHNLLTE